jgi:hypothetical protein
VLAGIGVVNLRTALRPRVDVMSEVRAAS